MTFRASSRALVVLALLMVPALAHAQRRTRGEPEADWSKIDKAIPRTSLKLSNKDVENMSPLKFLIDKRKDLQLTDEQLTQYKGLQSNLEQRNAPLLAALDSVRNDMKPTGRSPEDERARMIIARSGLTNLMAAFRASFKASADSALVLLPEAQRKTATQLLAEHDKETGEMLREKLGGR